MELRKEYIAHILLNRLQTQDRKSKELSFFKPRSFRQLYKEGKEHFVNDILVPHMNNLTIFYEKDNAIEYTTFGEISGFEVKNEILNVCYKGRVYTVLAPICKNRATNNKKDFENFRIPNRDFSIATIDHNPTLAKYKKSCNKQDFSTLFNGNINQVRNNPDLKDKLWEELKEFYKNTEIELVHAKHNTR